MAIIPKFGHNFSRTLLAFETSPLHLPAELPGQLPPARRGAGRGARVPVLPDPDGVPAAGVLHPQPALHLLHGSQLPIPTVAGCPAQHLPHHHRRDGGCPLPQHWLHHPVI